MPKLLIEKGPDKGKEFILDPARPAVIGRDAKAQLIISDPMCSRRHCALGSRNGTWLLKDLGSANGTFRAGRPVPTEKAVRLEIGDSFQLGETLVSFLHHESEAESDPLIGSEMAGYRVDGLLGRGAMGVVYKSHQLSLGRDVALKVLSHELAGDGKFTAMFIQEARAVAALNHPNILQVYDVGESDGVFFISMEIATGGSVLEELRAAGAIELDRSIEIVTDALSALEYAERKGIVHRDIKPDNLMLTGDGVVKLGDLGLAATSAELQSSQSGVFGTPHYIAPEQAMGRPVDHRADIYALGATWYRLLTGRTLFTGANVREILTKQVREPHTPLREIIPDIPPAISSILDKMLEKEPDHRYQSATEVRADIQSFLENRYATREAIGSLSRRQRAVVIAEPAKGTNWALIVIIITLILGGGGAALAVALNNGGSTAHIEENNGAPPPVVPGPGNIPGTQTQREQDAWRAYNWAVAIEKKDESGALVEYQRVASTWTGTEAGRKAADRAAEITKQRALEAEAINAATSRWATITGEVDNRDLPAFKLASAAAKIDGFIEELKANEHAAVQALIVQFSCVKKLTDIEDTAKNTFSNKLAGVANPVRGMKSSISLDDQIKRIARAIEQTGALRDQADHETLKSMADKQAGDLAKLKREKEDELAEQKREEREEAAGATAQALEEALEEIQAAASKLDPAGALALLNRFEQNDAGLKAHRESDEYASEREALDDLRNQFEIARGALIWLSKTMQTEFRDVDLKTNPTLAAAFPNAVSLRLLPWNPKDVMDQDSPKFRYDEVYQGRLPKDDLKRSFKDLSGAEFSEVVKLALKSPAVSDGLGRDKANFFTHRLGLGVLLLLAGDANTAYELIETVYNTSLTSRDAGERRRAREFMAFALAARAEARAVSGDLKGAKEDRDLLRGKFMGTRAARQ